MEKQPRTLWEDLLNISMPWQICSIDFSTIEVPIRIHIKTAVKTLNCPICGRKAQVFGQSMVEFPYLNIFQYRSRLFVYLPVLGGHNKGCRGELDPSVLSNTILLDLLLKVLKNTDILKPIQVLLSVGRTSR